jgi:hypothetical protein
MKLNLQPSSLILTLGFILAVPVLGRATVIYSDSFESDSVYSTPSNFTITNNTPYVGTESDNASVEGASGFNFGYTGVDGDNYVILSINGPNTNGTGIAESAPEYISITNANIGTYAADTTYTLNYLVAIGSGDILTSLLVDGATASSEDATESSIASEEGTIPGSNPPAQNTQLLVAGPTVTIDTATDVALVGQNIGVESTFNDDLEYSASNAVDDFVVTAISDGATPEPSTWALMFAGLLVLVGFGKVRSSARS